jgi:hypothetical protein
VRVLVRQRVLADDFEHLVVECPVGSQQALEAHHPALRPRFVGALLAVCTAPRDDQVDVLARLGVGQESQDRAISRLLLLGIETLAFEALGPVNRGDLRHGRQGITRRAPVCSGAADGAARP